MTRLHGCCCRLLLPLRCADDDKPACGPKQFLTLPVCVDPSTGECDTARGASHNGGRRRSFLISRLACALSWRFCPGLMVIMLLPTPSVLHACLPRGPLQPAGVCNKIPGASKYYRSTPGACNTTSTQWCKSVNSKWCCCYSYRPATYTCRAQAGVCDQAETCELNRLNAAGAQLCCLPGLCVLPPL